MASIQPKPDSIENIIKMVKLEIFIAGIFSKYVGESGNRDN